MHVQAAVHPDFAELDMLLGQQNEVPNHIPTLKPNPNHKLSLKVEGNDR